MSEKLSFAIKNGVKIAEMIDRMLKSIYKIQTKRISVKVSIRYKLNKYKKI